MVRGARRAVHGAARRLAEPSGAAVLGDFHDPAGRDLRQRLAEVDVDPSSYTRMVLFYDGSSDAPCRRPRVYAFTAPGSRVVRTCPTLGALVVSAPEHAEAVVIHEVLHTLGREENPPTSADITTAVERAVGPWSLRGPGARADPCSTGQDVEPHLAEVAVGGDVCGPLPGRHRGRRGHAGARDRGL